MSQSTIWGQLSMPLPASGSIPFVGSDNISIVSDVLNFNYDNVTKNLTIAGGISVDMTVVVGTAVTANTPAGIVGIPAGSSLSNIQNNLAQVGDLVLVSLDNIDATLTRVVGAISVDGIINITGNANATLPTGVAWLLVKAK